MDRHFQVLQTAIKEGRLPSHVRLVSISFDPDYDTPAVLKDHAALVKADRRIWTFATAPRTQIESFGARLGLDVIREADSAALTHNLRTAVIDGSGRLVTIFDGNDWTPEQAIATVKQIG